MNPESGWWEAMTNSPELERLADLGQLDRLRASNRELEHLLDSGHVRLADARNATLAAESRFDLAYNAAHSIALAALRRLGYRSKNRYVVFQALAHTVGMEPARWRVLAKAHETRNLMEYEGEGEVDGRLLEDVIAVVTELEGLVTALLP